ncbi:MAG: DUF1800 family protein [Bacteroidia bacterium]
MASLNPRNGLLGRRLAAHLLRRVTLGPTRSEIDTFAQMTATQAVAALTSTTGFALPSPPIDPQTGSTWVYGNGGGGSGYLRQSYMSAWWLREAFEKKAPHLAQKITWLYHTMFTASHEDRSSENQFHQIALFREYANGSLKDLARKIIMDNSMIEYLDSQVSTKYRPNENFPRELLELFTIGKGPQIAADNYTNYTEYDIQTAARIFTGIKKNEDYTNNNYYPGTQISRGRIDEAHHDDTNKTFSSAFGSQTILGRSGVNDIGQEFDDFITMVFNQPATAVNYAQKIYRFFAHTDITSEIQQDIIEPLAALLRTNNYDLLPALQTLLTSIHFYDEDDTISTDEMIGAKIKSPMEYFVSLTRFFDMDMPAEGSTQTSREEYYKKWWREVVLQHFLGEADMEIWTPPSVAGFNAYYQAPAYDRSWISANTLPFRYKMVEYFITGQNPISQWRQMPVLFHAMAFVTDPANISNPRNPDTLVQELIDYLFCESPTPQRFAFFRDDLLLDNHSVAMWQQEWDDYIRTGDATGVQPRIEALVRGLVQTPEFQLM